LPEIFYILNRYHTWRIVIF